MTMTPDDRGDLLFDLADVLNEYNETYDAEEIREEAIGFVKGWNSS